MTLDSHCGMPPPKFGWTSLLSRGGGGEAGLSGFTQLSVRPARSAGAQACRPPRSAWMGQYNRRPRRKLQYSPLVENFLRARRYSSVNLVRATSDLGRWSRVG